MAKSIIALILPEVDSPENELTSNAWANCFFYDENKLLSIVEYINAFVEFYKDEECCLMFDSKNLKAFTFLPQEQPKYNFSSLRKLRSLLYNVENFKCGDWRTNRISSNCDKYNLFHCEINDEVRTEIAARMDRHPDDDFLIVTYIPDFKAKKWTLKKDGKTYPIESLPMSIKAVFEWLSNHRHPQRVYNWNEKHGEFGKGSHPDNKGNPVSVLKGSREEAAEIMPKAIGIPYYDEIYCFDNKYNKYMEYKAECKYSNLQPGNDIRKYHSYHIDDDSEIPKRVKDKLSLINS